MRFFPAIVLTFLLVAAFGAPPAGAESIEETRRQLDEIEKRIREASQSLQQKQTAARDLERDLGVVERETTRLQGRVKSLERETARLKEDLSAKNTEIGRLQQEIARSEAQVRQRLTALYKAGEGGFLRIFFAEEAPARAAETYDFLSRIVRHDRALLEKHRSQVESLEAARAELTALQQKRQASLAALKGEQENLRRAMKLKGELLAQMRKEEEALDGHLKELRERSKRLSSLLKELESAQARKYTRKAPSDGPFSRQKGRLDWPAEGPVRIGFGTSRNPELGTLRESQGIVIGTPENRAIAAVWEGQVLYANWFRGFGNLLILDHGDGYYSLYAQAARLTRKVGDPVSRGDVLGYTGGEGVYFEIRHHGTPLDPATWLAPP